MFTHRISALSSRRLYQETRSQDLSSLIVTAFWVRAKSIWPTSLMIINAKIVPVPVILRLIGRDRLTWTATATPSLVEAKRRSRHRGRSEAEVPRSGAWGHCSFLYPLRVDRWYRYRRRIEYTAKGVPFYKRRQSCWQNLSNRHTFTPANGIQCSEKIMKLIYTNSRHRICFFNNQPRVTVTHWPETCEANFKCENPEKSLSWVLVIDVKGCEKWNAWRKPHCCWSDISLIATIACFCITGLTWNYMNCGRCMSCRNFIIAGFSTFVCGWLSTVIFDDWRNVRFTRFPIMSGFM